MSLLFETSLGDLTIDLYYEKCPNAASNIINLSRSKFYNGMLFTEITKDVAVKICHVNKKDAAFKALSDPKLKLFFADEYYKIPQWKFGLLTTANKNNSDLILSLGHQQPLIQHTVYGEVVEGLEYLLRANSLALDSNRRPLLNVIIKHVLIIYDPFLTPFFHMSSPYINHVDRVEYDPYNTRVGIEIDQALENAKVKTQTSVLTLLGDLPNFDAKPCEKTLFVCKLSPYTLDDDLSLVFSQFGMIKNCKIAKDWKTDQSLQYGFIEFSEKEACERAYLKMNNVLIDNCRIVVDFAQSTLKNNKDFLHLRKNSHNFSNSVVKKIKKNH